MAQIQKGTTYATGTQVTADNLNAHVDSAILLPGAIGDQTAGTAAETDLVLVSKSGVLNKVTAASLAGLVDTAPFLRTDGSAAMATGQQLTLGTTNQIAALNAASKGYVDALVPTGAIIAFYRSTTPAGWLECNGATITNSGDTTALYALIGATLPDLRGEFVRGWDHGRGIDSGRIFGSNQTESLSAHTHTASSPEHTHSVTSLNTNLMLAGNNDYGSNPNQVSNGYANFSGNLATLGGTAVSVTIGSTGGTETRPRNVAFMYCIKK
jgi:microcystin-dependent protein